MYGSPYVDFSCNHVVVLYNRDVTNKHFHIKKEGTKMKKTIETNATINNVLATLEGSNDALAQLLAHLLKQSEMALAIDVLKMQGTNKKRTIASVRTLSNEQLTEYLESNFSMVYENDFYTVACLIEFSARCVMGKLKGKYSMHCDNLHVRNRRFNFMHTYQKYCENGYLLERTYTASDVSRMVNNEYASIKETMLEYCENEKTVSNLLSVFMVKQRLNLVVEDIRNACLLEEKKDKNGFMYSDVELMDTFIESVLSWVYTTKETNLNAITTVVTETYYNFVHKQLDIVSYETKETSARKNALRAIDKEISYNRRISFEEIKDVHLTNSGAEKKGIYQYLTVEEMKQFNIVSNYIVTSDKIQKEDKADAIAMLYMRMLGYGYDAIATYLSITKRKVQNTLQRIAVTLATTKEYSNRIEITKDAQRRSVPVYVH